MHNFNSIITKQSKLVLLQSYPNRVNSFSKVTYVNLPNFVTNSIAANILPYTVLDDDYNDEEYNWDEDYYNVFY